MLSNLLEFEGAHVELALSGSEALRASEGKQFDLIISDISMPEMDGYELLRNLRARQISKATPALAVTGYGRPSDIERAHAEGFDEHLIKPLNLDQLLEAVRRLTNDGGT